MPTEDTSIPKYVVLEKSLIGNELHEAGAIVQYDGLPAENLQPTCDKGRARYQQYLDSNAERVAKLKDQFSESAVGDPQKFAQAVAKANAQATGEIMAAMPGMIAGAVAQALATAFPNGTAAPAAPAVDAAAPATDAAAAKPAGKAKAEKPADKPAAGDGEGLV